MDRSLPRHRPMASLDREKTAAMLLATSVGTAAVVALTIAACRVAQWGASSFAPTGASSDRFETSPMDWPELFGAALGIGLAAALLHGATIELGRRGSTALRVPTTRVPGEDAANGRRFVSLLFAAHAITACSVVVLSVVLASRATSIVHGVLTLGIAGFAESSWWIARRTFARFLTHGRLQNGNARRSSSADEIGVQSGDGEPALMTTPLVSDRLPLGRDCDSSHDAAVGAKAMIGESSMGNVPSHDDEPTDDVTQQMTRRALPNGGEEIVGFARVGIESKQRLALLHVAFCPPLDCVPQMEVWCEPGSAASAKTSEVQTFGARVEVKPSAVPNSDTFVRVGFRATASRRASQSALVSESDPEFASEDSRLETEAVSPDSAGSSGAT